MASTETIMLATHLRDSLDKLNIPYVNVRIILDSVFITLSFDKSPVNLILENSRYYIKLHVSAKSLSYVSGNLSMRKFTSKKTNKIESLSQVWAKLKKFVCDTNTMILLDNNPTTVVGQ